MNDVKAVGCSVVLMVAFVAVMVLMAAGYWLVYPWIVHQQTFAVRQSYGYVQSQQTKLETLASDFRQVHATIDTLPGDDTRIPNLEAQAQADVRQMQAQAALMNQSDIPADVRGIMIGGSQ